MIRRLFATAMDANRRQLLYHASKRGMLENELVLGGFARAHLPQMSEAELTEFKAILDQYDDDVNRWVMKRAPIPDSLNNSVWRKIVAFAASRANLDEEKVPPIKVLGKRQDDGILHRAD